MLKMESPAGEVGSKNDVWLSITLLDGAKIISKNIRKFNSSHSFRQILLEIDHTVELDLVSCHLSNIDSQTQHAHDSHNVDLDSPIHSSDMFKCKYVVFKINRLVRAEPKTESAFDLMMQSSKSYNHLPDQKPFKLHGKTFNAILDFMRAQSIGFMSSQLQFGEVIIEKLAIVIYYVDQMFDKVHKIPSFAESVSL